MPIGAGNLIGNLVIIRPILKLALELPPKNKAISIKLLHKYLLQRHNHQKNYLIKLPSPQIGLPPLLIPGISFDP